MKTSVSDNPPLSLLLPSEFDSQVCDSIFIVATISCNVLVVSDGHVPVVELIECSSIAGSILHMLTPTLFLFLFDFTHFCCF